MAATISAVTPISSLAQAQTYNRSRSNRDGTAKYPSDIATDAHFTCVPPFAGRASTWVAFLGIAIFSYIGSFVPRGIGNGAASWQTTILA